ncbi:5'/3'-nucleotidase SurE [Dactylosporangium sp. NPDC000555]|uniref:5'/3'-nucleotidase SurE n=1 Tax=Dactylosporangium sp. NPDC000555 TaxID=3154260 RepID=UPI00331CF51F
MRVLITNDDGIAAPGLRALARSARDHGHDVVVAAPHREASGSGTALTAVTDAGRLLLEAVELDGLPGVPAYSVAASPAYIAVLAAIGAFGPAPDALLSGINRGANAGHAILHSGTVGAALAAANEGLRALAVSLDIFTALSTTGADSDAALSASGNPADDALHWDSAGTLAARLLPWLSQAPPGTVLNLNVPDRPLPRIPGVRRATPAPFGQVQMTLAEAGHDFARITVAVREDEHPPGTDLALLAEGYATLTAIRPLTEDPSVTPPTD